MDVDARSKLHERMESIKSERARNAEVADRIKVLEEEKRHLLDQIAAAQQSVNTIKAEYEQKIQELEQDKAKNEALESKFFDCKNEQIRVDRQNSDDQKEKIELLIELESSRSFASTHAAVEKMRRVDTWTQEEREAIFEIALSNSQVRYIIGDLDVKMFYLGLLRNCQSLSEKAMEVKAMLEG